MIRLTLILCAAIYAGMILFSQPVDPGAEPVETARAGFDPVGALPAPASDAITPMTEEAPMTIQTADGEVIEISAVIIPSQVDEMVQVASYAQPAPTQETANVVEEIRAMVYVTGSSVNMRAGPSTSNPVVTALTRGAEAELIGEAGDGWVQIRHIASGQTGFMAGRFLSEIRP